MSNANGLQGFLGSRTNKSASQPTKTLQGGAAYTLSMDEKANQLFTMGLIRGNFYTGSAENAVKDCRQEMESFLEHMPYRATQHAVYAAENLGMKLFPVIWLVYLSTLEDKSLFKAAFPRIIGKNAKLLHDFMTLARKGGIRKGSSKLDPKYSGPNGMGQSIKKTINNWLYANLNDYMATRFTGKLEDVVRLTRPTDKDPVVASYLQYIFKPKDGGRRLTFARAIALDSVLNDLSSGTLTDETMNLIAVHKLQLEELKHTFGKLSKDQKQRVFEAFLPGLRFAALINNLVAIERAFATETRKVNKFRDGQAFTQLEVVRHEIPSEIITTVANKLRSYEDYRASKMLFFGLLTAHEMTSVKEWKDALNQTLKQAGKDAFSDVPDGDKIMVSADTSGSMGTMVTSSLSAVDVASYLAAAIEMSVPNSRAFATASHTKRANLTSNNLIDNAVAIKRLSVGMGTVFESLLEHYSGEKYVILVTDGQNSGNMERRWASLTNRPKGSKLIIWHVAGFNYFNKISDRSDVVYLKGYSDTLLKTLAGLLTGKVGQLDIVDGITL